MWQQGAKCGAYNATALSSSVVRLYTSAIKSNNRFSEMTATLTAYDASKPNYLTFAPEAGFGSLISQWMKRPNYQVLSTDYTNYAVIYSCKDMWPFTSCLYENLWVISRSRTVTDEQLDIWNNFYTEAGIPINKLIRVSQDECTN